MSSHPNTNNHGPTTPTPSQRAGAASSTAVPPVASAPSVQGQVAGVNPAVAAPVQIAAPVVAQGQGAGQAQAAAPVAAPQAPVGPAGVVAAQQALPAPTLTQIQSAQAVHSLLTGVGTGLNTAFQDLFAPNVADLIRAALNGRRLEVSATIRVQADDSIALADPGLSLAELPQLPQPPPPFSPLGAPKIEPASPASSFIAQALYGSPGYAPVVGPPGHTPAPYPYLDPRATLAQLTGWQSPPPQYFGGGYRRVRDEEDDEYYDERSVVHRSGGSGYSKKGKRNGGGGGRW